MYYKIYDESGKRIWCSEDKLKAFKLFLNAKEASELCSDEYIQARSESEELLLNKKEMYDLGVADEMIKHLKETVKYYQTDFIYDVQKMVAGVDNKFIWALRESGTYLPALYDIFSSKDKNVWASHVITHLPNEKTFLVDLKKKSIEELDTKFFREQVEKYENKDLCAGAIEEIASKSKKKPERKKKPPAR
ncbi:hypothetical protein M2150_001687 [Lachnospiraceae bacterium PM6-15]|uniref:hypothetical protein n=1 Tax=Ohessyouella blattaphilus TaxID=2949333 RepID=UPI003E2C4260